MIKSIRYLIGTIGLTLMCSMAHAGTCDGADDDDCPVTIAGPHYYTAGLACSDSVFSGPYVVTNHTGSNIKIRSINVLVGDALPATVIIEPYSTCVELGYIPKNGSCKVDLRISSCDTELTAGVLNRTLQVVLDTALLEEKATFSAVSTDIPGLFETNNQCAVASPSSIFKNFNLNTSDPVEAIIFGDACFLPPALYTGEFTDLDPSDVDGYINDTVSNVVEVLGAQADGNSLFAGLNSLPCDRTLDPSVFSGATSTKTVNLTPGVWCVSGDTIIGGTNNVTVNYNHHTKVGRLDNVVVMVVEGDLVSDANVTYQNHFSPSNDYMNNVIWVVNGSVEFTAPPFDTVFYGDIYASDEILLCPSSGEVSNDGRVWSLTNGVGLCDGSNVYLPNNW